MNLLANKHNEFIIVKESERITRMIQVMPVHIPGCMRMPLLQPVVSMPVSAAAATQAYLRSADDHHQEETKKARNKK